MINKTRIVPPFKIKATGNPENLLNSVKNKHLKTLELYNIKYQIEKQDHMEISADSNIILAGDI